MKKLSLLFVIMVLFFSCKKETESIYLDIDGIRAQLAAIPTVTKDEVANLLNSPKLKSGTTTTLAAENEPFVMVEIYDLSSDYYIVGEKEAVKFMAYWEKDQNLYRQKFLTIRQIFPVSNGVVNTNTYHLEYEVGCSLGHDFQLSANGSVNQIIYYFHFNNGNQFAYYGNGGNTSNIKLPPLANGKWQLMVSYFDGDLQQQFISDLVDYNSNIINLRLGVKPKNVVSIIQIDRSLLKGIYGIWVSGYDTHAVPQNMQFIVLYDESLPNRVSFQAPFNIWDINISGMYGCYNLSTKNAKATVFNADGTVTYIM